MSKRKFTAKQRIEAIKLSDAIGPKEAAIQLGMNITTLYRWRKAKYRRKYLPSTATKRIEHGSVTATGKAKMTASALLGKKYTVVAPNGFKVEGLSLSEAKEFLK